MKLTCPGWFVVFLSVILSGCGCSPPCTPGAKDCACKEASACNDGLICGEGNTCRAATMVGVQVSDPNVRGCEVLLSESSGSTVTEVSFSQGVQGVFVREAPRVAFSFVAPADARLPAEGLKVAVAGPAAGVTVTRVRCVDAAGARLPNATVSIQ